MFVRDKIIKDATQLVMLDIRGANQAEFFDQ
jgi:hypothetical protein